MPPSVAMNEDFELCRNIMLMRQFAELSAMEEQEFKQAGKRRKALLTEEQRKFLIQMERLASHDEGTH